MTVSIYPIGQAKQQVVCYWWIAGAECHVTK